MAKNKPKNAREKRRPSPYTRRDKRPYPYTGEPRLANGELQNPANQHPSNKYQ